ncbi:hypothetical protein B6U70_01025 [Euryarchaeota archaeon ex4484_162]|nr:MAG: hypothetical protein B6U70_01025 [Euryarchaeota archaeon ex4484_162]
MKKILVMLTIGILLGSIFGAVAIAKENKIEKVEKIRFSIPNIKEIDSFVAVDLKERARETTSTSICQNI